MAAQDAAEELEIAHDTVSSSLVLDDFVYGTETEELSNGRFYFWLFLSGADLFFGLFGLFWKAFCHALLLAIVLSGTRRTFTGSVWRENEYSFDVFNKMAVHIDD